jgi:hypothetical protein
MVNITNLPNEIILDIFEAGCSTLGLAALSSFSIFDPQPRRRKPFIALIRRVCRSWRTLADEPLKPHYWFAQASLTCNSVLLMDTQKLSCLAQWLRTFRDTLHRSNGSDLIVGLYYTPTASAGLDLERASLSMHDLTMLRLFIHGMHWLIPFRKQIIILDLQTFSTASCKTLYLPTNGTRFTT